MTSGSFKMGRLLAGGAHFPFPETGEGTNSPTIPARAVVITVTNLSVCAAPFPDQAMRPPTPAKATSTKPHMTISQRTMVVPSTALATGRITFTKWRCG